MTFLHGAAACQTLNKVRAVISPLVPLIHLPINYFWFSLGCIVNYDAIAGLPSMLLFYLFATFWRKPKKVLFSATFCYFSNLFLKFISLRIEFLQKFFSYLFIRPNFIFLVSLIQSWPAIDINSWPSIQLIQFLIFSM